MTTNDKKFIGFSGMVVGGFVMALSGVHVLDAVGGVVILVGIVCFVIFGDNAEGGGSEG